MLHQQHRAFVAIRQARTYRYTLVFLTHLMQSQSRCLHRQQRAPGFRFSCLQGDRCRRKPRRRPRSTHLRTRGSRTRDRGGGNQQGLPARNPRFSGIPRGSDPFMAPMALALGYGLLFATPLTLALVPCLYIIFDDIGKIFRKSETHE